MLQRSCTSIAEESESETRTAGGKISGKAPPSTSKGTTDERSSKTDNSESSSRLLSPKNARLSASALTEDESGSDRFSISDDDDTSADEEDSKTVDKDRRSANKQNNNNNNIQATSKQEEEMLKNSKLTPDQIREIKEAFHVFDNNGDGCITATELKKLVTSLGYNITEAELMDMMNQIDSDGNGAIDFPEFLALMTKNLEDCDPEDILQESFKVFDRDGSGFIGVSELDRVFKLLGQEFKDYEIEAMIKAADADGDGLVGYDDFMKMMNV
ncbi:calmodulin-like [Orbicella faveolata]|uniref:calmodulin-like n=1 Tax=Orbicella faveolata TaxID=48498 RepID=UPI0009E61CED|nr:calmodulin-like [Orbicella faveolata]